MKKRKQPDRKSKAMPVETRTIQAYSQKRERIQNALPRTQPRMKREKGAVIPFMSRGNRS
ncbi:hypothetical protein CSR02_03435 [Acetobacter pomorum]|uniref:Uncharacterized protein n=1 Tax=Acetobacter pomorum TaxID=65959 RepID=A0A2G4REK1_9PROT|nr:hypothetical protein CSR02_03435 [Acetobacter pomorum]